MQPPCQYGIDSPKSFCNKDLRNICKLALLWQALPNDINKTTPIDQIDNFARLLWATYDCGFTEYYSLLPFTAASIALLPHLHTKRHSPWPVTDHLANGMTLA